MNGTVHTIIGVTTGAAVVITQEHLPILQSNVLAPTAFIMATTLGSIVPDFDLPGRPLGFLGHRRFTHTLAIPALSLLLYTICPSNPVLDLVKAFLLGFAFAWIMHIIADLFQKKGVPLLWPFLPLNVHVHIFNLPVKYDKWFLILYCAVLGMIVYKTGLNNLQTRILGSSPSIIIAVVVAVFVLKKFFGRAYKETVKGRR